jgi:hypothetical protein
VYNVLNSHPFLCYNKKDINNLLSLYMIKKIGIGFLGMVLCFGLLHGNNVSAQTAGVDALASVSYNVDARPVGFFDRVKLFFTFNQEKKAGLLQDFSQRNFAIATQKIEQGNTVEAGLFFQKSDEHTARATVAVSRIPDLEKRNEILSRISNTSEVRLAVLTEVQSRVENETAKESLSRAIANQEQIHATAGVRAQANAEVQQMRVAVDSRDTKPVATVDTQNTIRPIVPAIDSTRSSECNANTPPWIKVLSPNGGEEYVAGENIEIKWETCNISSSKQIFIQLRPESGAMPHNIINAESPVNLNDGIEEVQIPQNTIAGQYRMRVGHSPLDHEATVIADISDNPFTINASSSGSSAFSCPGIAITSPQSNTQVSFPLSINGIIHPTSNPGPWGVFEAEAGHVVVKDGNGNIKSNPVILSLSGSWMHPNEKPFSVTIPLLTSAPYDANIWLHFSDNNPMDNAIPRVCDVSLSVTL